ncbi:DNA primase [Buchnera aphidicola (Phyllaphis fagi)]|uniref:DNA primase n=1 Tax=Buchnera aphidicola TaxID=9 RepID=UPI0034639605
MNYFIPKDFINTILEQTNIIDLISTRIKLKQYGNNYNAICPFHSEKQPSFTINHEKQYFYCFGCNIHGNAIDFLMKYDQLTFTESIEELAYINGLTIPINNCNEYNKKINKKFQLYKSIQEVSKIYQTNIKADKNSSIQIYLKKRKINKKMIDYFNIGFSQNTLNLLRNKNLNNKDYISNLILCGILIQSQQGYTYDRFQGRIIFPIKDKYGRIIGFGGRSLDDKIPKYINSPKTEIFDKGKQLYGIYETQKKYPKPKYLLVVEGYFDVISLTQFNIKYVVSSLGTSTTTQQIQILFKITKKIIYCYDGDIAGQIAAWKTLKKTLPFIHDGYSVKFIFLPINEDPDSIIHKEGRINFKKRIKTAIHMLDFFLNTLIKKVNLCSIHGKIKLLNLSRPLINKIPSILTKIYFRRAIGLKIDIIDENQLQKIFHTNKTLDNKNHNIIIKKTNMRILISLIIQNPKLSYIVPDNIKKIKYNTIAGLSLFIKIFETCNKYKNLNTGQLIELYRDQKIIFNIINKLAYWNNMISKNNIKKVFLDLINKIYNINLENKYQKLIYKDHVTGLNKKEKYKLWKINKILSKKN